MTEICFSGCGGLYNYYFGIANVIQKNFDLSDTIFTGKSAGCFPALVLAMDSDIDDIFYNYNLPFLREINSYTFGALFNWNDMVRKHTIKYLPNELDKINNRLHCHFAKLENNYNIFSWSPQVVNNWNNKSDLMECLIASTFIPCFDKKLFMNYRGYNCMDGFMCKNKLPVSSNRKILEFSLDKWRDMNMNWMWCYTNPEWATTLYKWGEEDANKNILELEEYFI